MVSTLWRAGKVSTTEQRFGNNDRLAVEYFQKVKLVVWDCECGRKRSSLIDAHGECLKVGFQELYIEFVIEWSI